VFYLTIFLAEGGLARGGTSRYHRGHLRCFTLRFFWWKAGWLGVRHVKEDGHSVYGFPFTSPLFSQTKRRGKVLGGFSGFTKWVAWVLAPSGRTTLRRTSVTRMRSQCRYRLRQTLSRAGGIGGNASNGADWDGLAAGGTIVSRTWLQVETDVDEFTGEVLTLTSKVWGIIRCRTSSWG
jgi:hypothetical protein